MARYNGPKNKLQRRIGEDLGLKTNSLKVARRIGIHPGQHGAKGRRKQSNFGMQLQEKQKVKYIYGVMEKQLRRLYEEASKNPTATGAALLSLLERRLDNMIFRAGWAPTRAAARQLVSHNHVRVNNKKMNIASYQIKVGDVVLLKDKAANIPYIAELLKDAPKTPAWLEIKGGAAQVKRLPQRDDIVEPIEEQMIVEFYSR